MESSHEAMEETPVARIANYLDRLAVAHEIVEHAPAATAAAEARVAHADPAATAKTVLISSKRGYALAVLPASMQLDLEKAEALIGAPVRICTETELAALSPHFEPGAIPPLGPDLPAPELLDPKLLDHERILCSGGDHRHSILLSPGAILEIADPTVADICG